MSILGKEEVGFSWFLNALGNQIATLQATGKRVHQARMARLTVERLLTYDDRLLTDMGLTSSDVREALAVGWDQDPTAKLAELRQRRRMAEHA